MQGLVAFLRELDPELKAFALQGVRIILILIGAWVLQALASRLVRVFHAYYTSRHAAGDQRARVETLSRVFRNAAAIVIAVVAGMLILNELGISIAPILATAGVAGIAIGFGAQSLIKDYFNGMFLLLDDQVRVGDVVEIAGKGGFVEEVTLRFVRLRDMDSHVHYVPNGEIKIVTNRTRGFATPVIDVPVAYRENPDEVVAIMRDVAAKMRAEPAWKDFIVEDLEIIGVDRWDTSGLVLRARFRVVPPIQQWNVKREYLKRLKQTFDVTDIEIPLPHLTVYAGKLKDGSAPPLPVMSKPPAP